MLKATFSSHQLVFKTPGGTSRGVLTQKKSWFIKIWNDSNPELIGTGECSVLPNLSPDDRPELEKKIREVCKSIHKIVPKEFLPDDPISGGVAQTENSHQVKRDSILFKENQIPDDQNHTENFHRLLAQWPAIRFALETALLDLMQGGRKILFPSPFTNGEEGVPINGLIWMGTPSLMTQQIEEKLKSGFKCLKLKIGAIDFEQEYKILKTLRSRFSSNELELRVDANGAFSFSKAPELLEKLARLDIHSIEQPIMAGQWDKMAQLCESSSLPIALDEELIGINHPDEKEKMISTIRPQYIILKPSLIGGFQASQQWIETASKYHSGWWVTSALESNIGLNAIAQWTYTLKNPLPQGLGTGQVFSNNIPSSLVMKNGHLWLQQ